MRAYFTFRFFLNEFFSDSFGWEKNLFESDVIIFWKKTKRRRRRGAQKVIERENIENPFFACLSLVLIK